MDNSNLDDAYSWSWSETKGILEFPPEIIERIFKLVSFQDLLNLRLTCVSFYEIASHPSILSLGLNVQVKKLDHLVESGLASLMPNIKNMNLIYGEYYTDPPKLTEDHFRPLNEKCTGLKRLSIQACDLNEGLSMAHLPKTISTFKLDTGGNQNHDFFFSVNACTQHINSLSELYITAHSDISPAALEGIAVLSNLRVLHLKGNYDPVIDDDSFAQILDGRLPNLLKLFLGRLILGYEAFHTIANSFRKLEAIFLHNCYCYEPEEAILGLKDSLQLKRLKVRKCSFISPTIWSLLFGPLVNLQHVRISGIIEDHMMRSICQNLPMKVEYLSIKLTSRQRLANSENFDDLKLHPHLKELILKGTKLSDTCISFLLPSSPNLTRLTVKGCLISEQAFKVIADTLHSLNYLFLDETDITNEGLVCNLPKLGELKELKIYSLHFTENAVIPIVDFLSSLTDIDIDICGNEYLCLVERFRFIFNGKLPVRNICVIKFTALTFFTKLLAAFASTDLIDTIYIKITGNSSEKENINYSLQMETIDISTRIAVKSLDAMKLFPFFRELKIGDELSLNPAVLKLRDRQTMLFKDLMDSLQMMNNQLLSAEDIISMAPLLTAFNSLSLRVMDGENLTVINLKPKTLLVKGRNINDDVLFALVSRLDVLVELEMCDTSVSLDVFSKMAPYLTHLHRFEFECSASDYTNLTADDALSVLREIENLRLGYLTLKGNTLTDAGLLSFNRYYHTLRVLKVQGSSMTTDGIKTLKQYLLSSTKVFFDNRIEIKHR